MADAGLTIGQTQKIDARQARSGSDYFIWDSALVEAVSAEHFDLDWWERQNRLTGQAEGRGTAAFIDAAPIAHESTERFECVLRHYQRGGLIAKAVTDHYVWTGIAKTRAFREWRLLAHMVGLGLPVPRPVAARVRRGGLSYTADLITQRIANARTLSGCLRHEPLPSTDWQSLGATIARFHQAGIYHHDLNANNILFCGAGHFSLIDFDKGRLRKPGRWCENNRRRLHRSLEKISAAEPEFNFRAAGWQALLGGYLAARSA